mgnify:CR=1 FL=1
MELKLSVIIIIAIIAVVVSLFHQALSEVIRSLVHVTLLTPAICHLPPATCYLLLYRYTWRCGTHHDYDGTTRAVMYNWEENWVHFDHNNCNKLKLCTSIILH